MEEKKPRVIVREWNKVEGEPIKLTEHLGNGDIRYVRFDPGHPEYGDVYYITTKTMEDRSIRRKLVSVEEFERKWDIVGGMMCVRRPKPHGEYRTWEALRDSSMDYFKRLEMEKDEEETRKNDLMRLLEEEEEEEMKEETKIENYNVYISRSYFKPMDIRGEYLFRFPSCTDKYRDRI